jgi:hypothetical protein
MWLKGGGDDSIVPCIISKGICHKEKQLTCLVELTSIINDSGNILNRSILKISHCKCIRVEKKRKRKRKKKKKEREHYLNGKNIQTPPSSHTFFCATLGPAPVFLSYCTT